MYCSKLNCGIRNNKIGDPYSCDNIRCTSRQRKSYHDEETYIKNQGEKTIKNPAK